MDAVRMNQLVTIRFTLRTQVAPDDVRKQPETETRFVFGVEEQAPSLEAALEGARPGHRFSVHVPAAEIYGERDTELIREIPKQGLVKQRLREGQYYRQMKKGSLVSFKVLEVRDDTVLVDFNEPLAGLSAFVEGEVTAVRPASDAEIAEAHENHRMRKIGCG